MRLDDEDDDDYSPKPPAAETERALSIAIRVLLLQVPDERRRAVLYETDICLGSCGRDRRLSDGSAGVCYCDCDE